MVERRRDPRLLRVSLMVTGDLNAAVVEWIVQYRIGEPTAYLFNVRNPIETPRDAAESVMREVVGIECAQECAVGSVGRGVLVGTEVGGQNWRQARIAEEVPGRLGAVPHHPRRVSQEIAYSSDYGRAGICSCRHVDRLSITTVPMLFKHPVRQLKGVAKFFARRHHVLSLFGAI